MAHYKGPGIPKNEFDGLVKQAIQPEDETYLQDGDIPGKFLNTLEHQGICFEWQELLNALHELGYEKVSVTE